MKKTSINILCVLIILILSSSVIVPLFSLGFSLGSGFVDGFSLDNQKLDVNKEIVDVAFNPDFSKALMPSDSIRLDDGREFPVSIIRASVYMPENHNLLILKWLSRICEVLTVVLLIFLIVFFLKFVFNINKGEIFVKKNVRCLRNVGLFLISIALLQIMEGVMEDYRFQSLELSIEGYDLSTFWLIPWMNLLIGLMAMLFAQVWARGIAMKEEQELTI